MKVLQYAASGLFLTLTATFTAAAQQSASPAPASPPPAASSSKPLQLSTLGGDAVKAPDHPLTMEQMKELYEVMGYGKQIEQSREAVLMQQRRQASFIPSDVWDDLDATSKKVDYVNAFYDVYKKYLSTEDAAKVIDFAKTPAGKDFLDNVATLTRETSAAVQKEQRQAGMEVQSRHKDEIDAAVKKYRDEQQQQQKGGPSLGPTNPGSPSGSPSTPPSAPPPSATPHN